MNEVKRYMHSDQRGPVEVIRGKYVLYEDYTALKAERDALATENLALKELYKGAVKELDDTCFEIGMMRGEKSMEHPAPDTPATDVYANQLRAEGVEMFGKKCSENSKQAASSDLRSSWWVSAEHADDFAANLRKEKGND